MSIRYDTHLHDIFKTYMWLGFALKYSSRERVKGMDETNGMKSW